MNVSQLKMFCIAFPSVTEPLYGKPYNFLVYSVGGRKFAYFKTSQPERWRFSLRVTPERLVELTDMAEVKPAGYRGRYGWITIVNVSAFPADYLEELVDWSYRRAFASPRKLSVRHTLLRNAVPFQRFPAFRSVAWKSFAEPRSSHSSTVA